MSEDVESTVAISHVERGTAEDREAMLNDLLHAPLDTCTATEAVQQTTQEGLDAY